ncbi:2-oxo-4-hydroxy-4-carboxy-5-ureidoimidazoline decarboxylase [Marinomonas sp. 5E14-1]|uniref:2-oxo-4-hydroxy-4-carboxy-5-ureidoimidazoline decarboxylase n=1 Tax=Marinomonas sp. 5E14-1 TaxID=3153922 RepID=UPI003267C068
MNTLSKLNDADDDLALSMILPLIERAPIVAKRVSEHRPFADDKALCDAILHELRKLNEEESLALFRAHPELAPNQPHLMTEASQQEQARHGLTSQDSQYREKLSSLNDQYQEKFGFPFIVALACHEDMGSVIQSFEMRLADSREAEVQRAIEQIHAVSSARVQTLSSVGNTNAESKTMHSVKSNHPTSSLAVWSGVIGGGVLFIISVVFVIGGIELGLGSPFRLGTGAFPFITGLILGALSLAICFYELRGDGLSSTPDWIGSAAICAALAVFALTAERLGLVPAAFLTVFVASLPERNLSLVSKTVLGSCVGIACWILFIELLNLPFKPFVGF